MVEQKEETPAEITEDLITADGIIAASDSGIDYDKLIDKYGCFPISPEMIERIEKVSNMPVHHFIRRGVFFCERDLKLILDSYEKKKPFYLYTGRGPSAESMHMGHTIPFIFTKYLQDAFDVILVI